jgi:hypothetical protein
MSEQVWPDSTQHCAVRTATLGIDLLVAAFRSSMTCVLHDPRRTRHHLHR